MAIRTGIASVTFRRLAVREIVDLVADCGLEGIEWGGDVHVPPGDVELAREVSAVTRDAGLRVSSYGSYWRAGEQDRESAEAVLRSAVALEAPVLRIWAGARPSAEADEAYRELVVEQTLMLARMAFAHGIVTAFEYHSHSLTDCTRSALQLLRQVREQGVRTYWQPPGELGDTELIRSLQAVLPDLAYLHVFHWDTTGRCPLEQGVERWLPLLRKVAGVEREVWALLEFVRGDSVASFREDAAVLRGLAARVGRD